MKEDVILESRSSLIAWFNAQVGYVEGANNWNKYAEAMDKIDGLTWGAKQNQPWCGTFVLAGFVENYGVDAALALLCSPKPTSIPLCSAAANYFKNAGRWYTGNPQAGDVVFFNVSGGINHTGVVTAVGMGAITTVEGNSSDMVARRTYAIGAPSIAGYGRPNWSVLEDVADADIGNNGEAEATDKLTDAISAAETVFDTNTCAALLPMLQEGDASEAVRSAQRLLIASGYPCGGPYSAYYHTELPDGEFGHITKASVMIFQAVCDLKSDGIIGAKTWAALITT